jgi:hypothetical protein
MAHTVEWFFGRGLSIGCGLTWVVPSDWHSLPRDEQIARIKAALVSEMSTAYVDTGDIRLFLDLLAKHTVSPWRHQFYTTNWDFLLQREILALDHKVLPPWCAETHVYHLNGTVEDLPDNSRRSMFVLESDPPGARVTTTEGNIAYNKFIWSQTFVVVGMSFECEVDKYLLSALKRVEDDLPIGESCWIVLNPNTDALSATCHRLQAALPRAKVVSSVTTFRAWLDGQAPELQSRGAIAF